MLLKLDRLHISDLIIFTLIFLDQSSNCSIAAALNVSAAPKITDFLIIFKKFSKFTNRCCFPTPFTPEHNNCGLLDSKESKSL